MRQNHVEHELTKKQGFMDLREVLVNPDSRVVLCWLSKSCYVNRASELYTEWREGVKTMNREKERERGRKTLTVKTCKSTTCLLQLGCGYLAEGPLVGGGPSGEAVALFNQNLFLSEHSQKDWKSDSYNISSDGAVMNNPQLQRCVRPGGALKMMCALDRWNENPTVRSADRLRTISCSLVTFYQLPAASLNVWTTRLLMFHKHLIVQIYSCLQMKKHTREAQKKGSSHKGCLKKRFLKETLSN